MFKNPFSFNGRIRRLEYGLSVIIYFVYIILEQMVLVGTAASSSAPISPVAAILFLLLFIPVLWFVLAQNAKRCHDVGVSGWWQLIPFYGLWLLFADGESGPNEYGDNPKGIGNHDFSFESNETNNSGQ